MKIETEILNEISEFCEASGVSENKLLLSTVKDHKLADRLRDGRGMHSKSINAIRDYIKNYKKSGSDTAKV